MKPSARDVKALQELTGCKMKIEVVLSHLSLELAFSQAMHDARGLIRESDDDCDPYSFRLKLVSTELEYYDFGDRNSWIYTFEVQK